MRCAQIIPPHDEGIAAAILKELELWPDTGAQTAGQAYPYTDPAARWEGGWDVGVRLWLWCMHAVQ